MATANPVENATEPCRWPAFESLDENLRAARRVATVARHAAEDAVDGTALKIRHRPLQAVGLAVAGGLVAGAVIGFGAGWFAQRRG